MKRRKFSRLVLVGAFALRIKSGGVAIYGFGNEVVSDISNVEKEKNKEIFSFY